jgi:CRP/FNR family transcriptional regulator, cyclic AMP receptor protein
MAFGSKPAERTTLLRKVPFFESFSDEEIRRVVELSDEVTAPAGAVIVDQGDPGTHCYVVMEGTTTVYVRGEYVAESGPGSMIGEMALIDHRPRTATVVADTDVRLLRFDSAAFRTLIDEMPKASEQVLRVLNDRLRKD